MYFSPSEFEALVAYLEKARGLTREIIIKDYMFPHLDSYTARDDFPDGHCIFFEKGKGCSVYEVRPSQCRDFPFWKCNLTSKSEWEETAKMCPGMNQGREWSPEEIYAISSKARL